MLTWQELTLRPFVQLRLGQTLAYLLSFVSLMPLPIQMLSLAEEPAPLLQPHTSGVGIVYHGSPTSIGRVELNSNQDTSTLAVVLEAATELALTSVHVIMIMR